MSEVFEDVQVVSNRSLGSLDVWFEPWGARYVLASGEFLRVVGQSPHAGRLEVATSDGAVAVFAWAQATIRVYNGEALVADFSLAVPDLPPGMSTRSFVGLMFGRPARVSEDHGV